MMVVTTVTRRRGRPTLAPTVVDVSLRMPADLYDCCCREALARDVPVAVVIREALRSRYLQRGQSV